MRDNHHHNGAAVPIPPPPDAAVQETAFAADTASDLAIVPHEPIDSDSDSSALPPPQPHQNTSPSSRRRSSHTHRNGYGTAATTTTAPGASGAKSAARALAPDLLRGLLMVLMALDHNGLMLRSWAHGTAIDGEQDSGYAREWNRPAAYAARTLSHLCAPGFTFLLGMGVVYFGRSRTNLGWSAGRMVRHFLVRAVVLTAVSVVMGWVWSYGQVWFLNIVLFALGVDYLIAGLVWLGVSKTEQSLAKALLRVLPERKGDDHTEPLLQNRQGEEDIAPDRAIIRAADISWHVHNVALMALAVVTVWWNIWLSPTGGYCGVEPVPKMPDHMLIRIWFYSVEGPRVLSGFPPLGWLSFAILGLVYGRVILARSWSAKAISIGNALVGAGFALVFVLTRLLHFGNLSEDCLQMAEHIGAPAGANQYLASVESFFYLVKYPPDVAFWSFTMAGNFFLLAFFGAIPPALSSRVFKPLLVYGTSALFFYVVHIYMLAACAQIFIAWLGVEVTDPFTGKPAQGVTTLWGYFANWALVLAILYPLCQWYGAFKRTKGPDSIWRFF